MPVDRGTFDADLTAFTDAVTGYISAVDAFIANPAVIDLAAEDASVASAKQAVADAQSRIPVTPPPPGP